MFTLSLIFSNYQSHWLPLDYRVETISVLFVLQRNPRRGPGGGGGIWVKTKVGLSLTDFTWHSTLKSILYTCNSHDTGPHSTLLKLKKKRQGLDCLRPEARVGGATGGKGGGSASSGLSLHQGLHSLPSPDERLPSWGWGGAERSRRCQFPTVPWGHRSGTRKVCPPPRGVAGEWCAHRIQTAGGGGGRGRFALPLKGLNKR